MTPALNVAHARKVFGGLVAVNDVSFDVGEGELFGLIGPNGSGKTTMLNLISGALSPTAGEIRLGGHPISGLPAHRIARRGVARTFQLVRVLPGLSAEENVMAGAAFGHRRLWSAEARDLARSLLDRVGLRGRTHLEEINRAYELISRIVADGQKSKIFREDIDPAFAAMVFYGAIEQLLSGWIFGVIPGSDRDFDEARELIVKTICEGLQRR